MQLEPGQIVNFFYKSPIPSPPGHTNEFKVVFVLNPNWMGMLHSIDLGMISPADSEVLDAIFDPNQKGKRHHMPLVNDILRRMDPIEEIKNPVSFYAKFVKPFLRNKDAYRTYWYHRMSGLSIEKTKNISGHVINPNPLFKSHDSAPVTPFNKEERLGKIKSSANKLFHKVDSSPKTPPIKKPKIKRGKIQTVKKGKRK